MANRYEDKVASVSKALTIMELLSKDPQGMGLVEISNQAGMNKNHRLSAAYFSNGKRVRRAE